MNEPVIHWTYPTRIRTENVFMVGPTRMLCANVGYKNLSNDIGKVNRLMENYLNRTKNPCPDCIRAFKKWKLECLVKGT